MSGELIGSGRRHGHRPEEPGPELDLYLATHGDTYWLEPDPVDVARLICWYRTLPGCGNGGSLHIVVEDYNCEDQFVTWCAGYASGKGDTCGAELAGLLERMDERVRIQAVRLANANENIG